MLEATDLSLSLKGRRLLDGVSISFRQNQLHGILGLNGAGKSTLLKVLAGIWSADNGTITWNGADLMALSRRDLSRIVTFVPQSPQVLFNYTVEQFVAMGRYSHHDSGHWSLIEEALHTVDASHLHNRLITGISSGERQRIYLARALVTQSPILLLDEPTTSLDIGHQIDIWKLLTNLASSGRVVIASSHDLTSAAQHCQQVTLLNEGQVISHGPFNTAVTAVELKNIFGVDPNELPVLPSVTKKP